MGWGREGREEEGRGEERRGEERRGEEGKRREGAQRPLRMLSRPAMRRRPPVTQFRGFPAPIILSRDVFPPVGRGGRQETGSTGCSRKAGPGQVWPGVQAQPQSP